MATEFKKTSAGEVVDLNTQFSLVDGTSYLIVCNNDDLILSEQDDGEAVPTVGLTVARKTPLIIQPVAGKTIYGWTSAGGIIVVTEAP